MRGKLLRQIAGYIRRHHIGLLALFVALGGTAYAVQVAPKNSVVSKSIRKDAVRTSDIKDRGIKPQDLGLAKTVSVPGTRTITAQNPAAVTAQKSVRVGSSGLVSVHVRTLLRKSTGTACLVHAGIAQPDGGFEDTNVIFEDTNAPSLGLQASSPVPDSYDRIGRGIGGWVVIASEPGVRQVRLRLSAFSASCIFQDARLVAVPVG